MKYGREYQINSWRIEKKVKEDKYIRTDTGKNTLNNIGKNSTNHGMFKLKMFNKNLVL